LWWILTAAVYQGTRSNFLRAESGWYLWLSHSNPSVQHDFEKVLLTKSISGHYAPLAFLAEFATAKFVGTRGGFWKWRQITVLALLATGIFLLARHSGSALQLGRLWANLSAAGFTAIFVFQPQMRDFVAWPFMILQLFWLICSTLALIALIRMVQRPTETRWPWLAAAAAYGSLQFLGLGMATVAATAAGMLGSSWVTRRCNPSHSSTITIPLLSMAAMSALHSIGMLHPVARDAIAPDWQFPSFLMASLGFIPHFFLATLRSFFLTGPPITDASQIARAWPCGLAILLGAGLLVIHTFRRFLRNPMPRNGVRFILQTFASISFFALIALTAMRQWQEPAPNGFANYLIGARYLVPGTFMLAGLLLDLLLLFASLFTVFASWLAIGLGICAVVNHLQFAAHVYPRLMPGSMISHRQAWQSIVAMARECRRADLAIPNVPLSALTQGYYDNDLKQFEPLLRADLELPLETTLQIAPWTGFSNESSQAYFRDVPALAQVKKRLGLEAKK